MTKGKFTAYTKDTDAEAVAVLFKAKHGYPPAQVVDGKTVWLAGPLGENGNGKRGGLHGELLRGTQISLLAQVEAERVEVTPERARQLALEWEAIT